MFETVASPLQGVGRALVSLESVERAQTPGRYIVDKLKIREGSLVCSLGDVRYTVSGEASTSDIVAAATQAGIKVEHPLVGQELKYIDPSSQWMAWAQLHYDLGAFETELMVPPSRLTFVDIRLLGLERAQVSVSDGISLGIVTKVLGDNVLEGLPLELVHAFYTRDASMMFAKI